MNNRLKYLHIHNTEWIPVASLTDGVNPRLAKRPLKTNGRLANLELTSLVKEATGVFCFVHNHYRHQQGRCLSAS